MEHGRNNLQPALNADSLERRHLAGLGCSGGVSRQDAGAPAPLLLAGPTAVGKSAIALLLAERLGGEIISVDSMQVYRGLDIGTAKPSAADRARVPHHLIDVMEMTESFDVAP